MVDEKELNGILSRYQQISDKMSHFPHSTLVAVSKRQEPERLQVLMNAGHKDFGENYLQEWLGKKNDYQADIRWHFVGQVQSRKLKDLIQNGVYSIHGLGSESSLRKLTNVELRPAGPLFVQLNIEAEEQKNGIDENVLAVLAKQDLLGIIDGVMTLPPLHFSKEEIKKHFRRVRQLGESYGLAKFSMGMSDDWEIALDEGSTHVRVGTSIFGQRAEK